MLGLRYSVKQMPATDYNLPFAHLNLRRNPFGSAEIEDRPSWAVVEVDDIPTRLQQPGFVVQIIGERGHGKTTHLMAIRAAIQRDVPYFHLREGEPIPVLPDVPLLFVDETQRMTPKQRSWLFQKHRSSAIGTHEDHSEELRKADVDFVTIPAVGLSAEQLHKAANLRIETARRNSGPVPTLSRQTAQRLVDEFGGDVRTIESKLYDLIQQLEGPADARL